MLAALLNEVSLRLLAPELEGVELEVHLSPAAARRVQAEEEVARGIVDAALRPDPAAPERPGARLFAVVSGVRVYVRGEP